jgi:hypothetical protein
MRASEEDPIRPGASGVPRLGMVWATLRRWLSGPGTSRLPPPRSLRRAQAPTSPGLV